jgi:hypothetical protein
MIKLYVIKVSLTVKRLTMQLYNAILLFINKTRITLELVHTMSNYVYKLAGMRNEVTRWSKHVG